MKQDAFKNANAVHVFGLVPREWIEHSLCRFRGGSSSDCDIGGDNKIARRRLKGASVEPWNIVISYVVVAVCVSCGQIFFTVTSLYAMS